ncbi:vWA domain-containing protein [Halorubrum halodurans]|uniref:VWFA domain-containing protein n=1 Tax=Halorubrum halodurans TaxID=1383851 RepID=A0A256IJZ8_9EURY|nr:vWA domain-containing protein [Halorubrum halodurans]OYR56773.1 hypothetical protein DJ70_07655 [Halorubrum halodurans]
MSDNNGFEISRRKALAGLGGIGVASAGAGLGTSAYFSDTESFENNSITAGELDLKVDWQQSYYGAAETVVPVNAYPDHDGDGLQSIDGKEYVLDNEDGENVPIELTCEDLESGADLPDDVFTSPNRSADDGGPIEQQDSLVALDDVKPGDWGEITFSLHLCDNPGYVWLTADDFSQSGGTLTEPERVSMNSSDPGSVTESDDTGDLADNTYVELWYDDDCDNVRDTGGGETGDEFADVVIVMDRSGSMSGSLSQAQTGANQLISALGPNDQVGLVSFSTGGQDGDGGPNDSTLDAGLTGDHGAVQTAVNGLSSGGRTNMEAAVERAHEELTTGDTFSEYGESGNARSGARKIMVVLGDGSPNEGTDVTDSDNTSPEQEATNAKSDDIEIFTIAYGSGSPSGILGDMASDPANYPDVDQFAFSADVSDVVSVFQDIGGVVGGGEQLILGEGDGEHDGPVTLAEAMAIMERNDGRIPLDGTADMGYGEGATSPERDCFPAGAQKCIGMKWWVPAEVGNVIQGDSVEFDLGFYTEQCRHNDGSGQAMNGTDSDGGSGNATS